MGYDYLQTCDDDDYLQTWDDDDYLQTWDDGDADGEAKDLSHDYLQTYIL